MDRIEFIHSINPNNITTTNLFVEYIDQSMLLYEIIPEGSDVNVSDNTLDSITFNIQNTKTNINKLAKYINNNSVLIEYRKPIFMQYNVNNNTMILTMKM